VTTTRIVALQGGTLVALSPMRITRPVHEPMRPQPYASAARGLRGSSLEPFSVIQTACG
jgi:hypothetical protein